MGKPLIHPNWDKQPEGITDGYSLEITAKDVVALREAAPLIPAETPVAVTSLPGEELSARIAATVAVRELGFEPMPHFSARRILSREEFETYLDAVVRDAGVKRCFLVAGDPPEPQGPFFDSSALIATGSFERNGITAIGIGGHPEGHPIMSAQECWDVLALKIADIESRGMAPLVVTQFGFDADAFLGWLKQARQRGIDTPIRIGVPGPAGIKTLLRFAARCGVGASASVMAKYGLSITNLLGSGGPDKLVDRFAASLGAEHGRVRLHFYPFGGLGKTVEWIGAYERKNGLA
ncbi:methylenetetrahydrofolate reductase [Novosphingobium flavum]|uniref:Methylenetetrahydrofolate reductase n=1 Tax=Novosphingobium aerophilum TaxID=2839843 RepID=A0A7X1F685_9SPHN|nr:methylenetetrahydrofolate reductase [Novosphingobium aerophilum]MBC2651166.1 methylenetetrahydrofolate reductase [Novosphingobium aerophilum]MBC2660723.1 methylenetetrahydrofolate reductase [Novosphingobium aerophilum]